MTGLHADLTTPADRAEAVRQARPTIPELVQRISTQVQGSIPTYSGSRAGRRRRLIDLAVSAAIDHYLTSLENPAASSRSVDELFRRMGHGEATEEHGLADMQSALRIAAQEGWHRIRSFAAEHDLSADALGSLGDALFAYVDHLADQARLGYDAATRAMNQNAERARRLLVQGLMNRAPIDDIRILAAKASWILPSQLIVVSVDLRRGKPLPELSDLPPKFLVHIDAASSSIICDASHQLELMEELRPMAHGPRAARSWPVPLEQCPDAVRWTTRLLDMAHRGIVAPSAVLDCADHRPQLWLHAEPAVREVMVQELLEPILAETPNSRQILSETLLAWLESRASAPAIAEKLGVHPQTVRYRWKRIHELFGDNLSEPEFVMQAIMLLEASVPLWKAGDMSDFERYRNHDANNSYTPPPGVWPGV